MLVWRVVKDYRRGAVYVPLHNLCTIIVQTTPGEHQPGIARKIISQTGPVRTRRSVLSVPRPHLHRPEAVRAAVSMRRSDDRLQRRQRVGLSRLFGSVR